MKALIVDDENHVREGITLLADWKNAGITEVFEASDGDDAIQLIKRHQPQIVFTDMKMPNKDGITLLKWIQEEKYRGKTIVVSGYDDYQFMRKAINYGSFDYILKPVDPDVLNETLMKAVVEWKKEEEERTLQIKGRQMVNEVKPLYWDRIFTQFLTHSYNEEQLGKVNKEFGITSETNVQVVLYPVQAELFNHYKEQPDLVYFTLLNIFNEVFKNGKLGIAFRNCVKENEIIILSWTDKQTLNTKLIELNGIIQKTLKTKSSFCVGGLAVFPTGVHISYENAAMVYLNLNLLARENQVVFNEDNVSTYKKVYLFDYFSELHLAVKSSSVELLDEVIRKIFRPCTDCQYVSIEQLNIWNHELYAFKKHMLDEYQLKCENQQFLEKKHLKIGDYELSDFINIVRKDLVKLIDKMVDTKQGTENETIYDIEMYIKDHFYKEITLQELAEQFYLSREYISRKFKKVFGENISDYVTKIRIERAKLLLKKSFSESF